MIIRKVNIENYKCFNGKYTLELNPRFNILVGNNESGKSTILEAINLALTGILNGRYLRNELSQYLFNNKVVNDYCESISLGGRHALEPPCICIEVYFEGDDCPRFEGNGNSDRTKASGVSFRIEFDPDYQSEYEAFVREGDPKSLPVEYYRIAWQSFAREPITARSIPLKSVLIDSSSNRYQNGSDVYISRIIQAGLDDSDKAAIAQEYRRMKDLFGESKAIKGINEKIGEQSKLSEKSLSISVDLATVNSWQTTLMTYLDDVAFHQVGKGEQCIIKTNLALGHKRGKDANVVLLEEPENHLTHTKLNELLRSIEDDCTEKQIIVTTHNSFVANKLGLEHIILLRNQRSTKLTYLPTSTFTFFKKLSGYQTLRLLLCSKAVLVEGDSDELIFQKAYMSRNGGQLPIQNGIDVISVGTAFKRFLKIAETLDIPVAVITDNDGDYDANVMNRFSAFEDAESIRIFADSRNNLTTLEPQFIDANSAMLTTLCNVFGKDPSKYAKTDKLLNYMEQNKTSWALKVFDSKENVRFPKYIKNAVSWCDE